MGGYLSCHDLPEACTIIVYVTPQVILLLLGKGTPRIVIERCHGFASRNYCSKSKVEASIRNPAISFTGINRPIGHAKPESRVVSSDCCVNLHFSFKAGYVLSHLFLAHLTYPG